MNIRLSARPLARTLLTCGLALGLSLSAKLHAQTASAPFDEDQLGAWYMYFYTAKFGDSRFGIQGDAQFRNWNVAGDLEQLLLRSGLTYQPKDFNGLLTLGYASITTGAFGKDFDQTVHENRIYQEALLPHKLAEHVLLTHRFRYEQRFNEGQDFRTRFRYNLFVNIPFNGTTLTEGVVYAALYNELFVNGEREIGDGRTVQFFDRNRTYYGLGYGISEKCRVQLGYMRQRTNANVKGQLQVSLHQRW